MAKKGRKSKYEANILPHLDRIPKWRRKGFTEEQICKKLNVGVATFNRYKNDYWELREALKRGKEYLIEELEESLYKKALGFSYAETKTLIKKDAHGHEIQTIEKHDRYASPDTGALAFALKNLAPQAWSNKDTVDINKAQIETEFIKEKIKLFKGERANTDLMTALIKGQDQYERD